MRLVEIFILSVSLLFWLYCFTEEYSGFIELKRYIFLNISQKWQLNYYY